jgi:hypothetical protein
MTFKHPNSSFTQSPAKQKKKEKPNVQFSFPHRFPSLETTIQSMDTSSGGLWTKGPKNSGHQNASCFPTRIIPAGAIKCPPNKSIYKFSGKILD